MLYSANRFKNLCPEYVAEAVAQQNLAAAKAEAEKQNMDKFNVQQSTSPGKEGSDDPAPNASHIVSPTDQQQEGVIGDFIGGAVDKVKNFISGGNNNSQSTTSEPASSGSTTATVDLGDKPEVDNISKGDEQLSISGTFLFPKEATEEKAEPIDANITARKVEEAADVSEPEEVDFVNEAAYIDYLLESLDETEE